MIEVTVVGGYLGAGKTTLVNRLLSSADPAEPIAVLVNDFGDINIDAELITSSDGNTVELANGCICCSLIDGFATALTTIRDFDPAPSRLVIEASGVADPATVAAYAHTPGFELDAVVVLADAETVEARSTDRYVGDTVLSQLAGADVIVLNKSDLVSPSDLDRCRTWLAERWPSVFVHLTSHGEVPPEILFGRASEPRPARPGTEAPFVTATFTSTEPLARAAVEAAMEALADDVVRVKGFVQLADAPDQLYLLQRVGPRWTLLPHTGPPPAEPTTRVVAIGLPGSLDNFQLAVPQPAERATPPPV